MERLSNKELLKECERRGILTIIGGPLSICNYGNCTNMGQPGGDDFGYCYTCKSGYCETHGAMNEVFLETLLKESERYGDKRLQGMCKKCYLDKKLNS